MSEIVKDALHAALYELKGCDSTTRDETIAKINEAIAALHPSSAERDKAITMLEGAVGLSANSGGFALSVEWARTLIAILRAPVATGCRHGDGARTP